MICFKCKKDKSIWDEFITLRNKEIEDFKFVGYPVRVVTGQRLLDICNTCFKFRKVLIKKHLV